MSRSQLLRRSLRGRRRELAGLAGWSLVQAVPAVLSGRLLARALDRGFLAHDTAAGFAWLGALAVAVVVGAWGTRQAYLRLAGLVEPFRDELVEAVVTGTVGRCSAWGAPPGTAGVASVTHHVEILREAWAGVLLTGQGFAVAAAGAVVGLATLLPAAIVVVVPPLLAGVALFAATVRPMAARQRRSILAEEALAAASAEAAGGLRDVVACGAEDAVEARIGGLVDDHAGATRALARATAVQTAAVAVGGWLPAVLLLVAGPRLRAGGASTGALIGALTYVLYGLLPALQTLVRELGGSGLWLLVALERVAEVAAPPAADPVPAPATPRGYAVRLRGVAFRYGSSPEPVVRSLDLDVPEGDHLAVVGPSGAGKSTLAALVAGLLAPDAGEVLVGGVPAAALDPGALAALRVLIPQEAYVFAGSLRENAAYLRPDVPTAQLDGVAGLLGASPLVERLGGWDAEVDPGALSAGERQLVALVRSYLSPAPLVVLDEATCHLDPAAEARVEEAFAARPGSLIVVAHRISSALRARRVLVLDGGLAAAGTHADLLACSPAYRELVGYWAPAVTVSRRRWTVFGRRPWSRRRSPASPPGYGGAGGARPRGW
ncbi:MAG TPA: ABC transporter ATP-binding protein [Acidimicrobiales bacterium]|nr:ABC transporter ATP-binding protein [Acidimicrobiales bacterium]